LEGNTQKEKNPFLDGSLAWATWIIAKLGKCGGYVSQGPPGYITMKKGLDTFCLKYDAFSLACEAMKDVYKE
jgi:hypothetical protein